MTMNRRDFVLTSAALGAGFSASATLTGSVEAADVKKDVRLKLSSQISRIPGKSIGEKLDRMLGWGFEAVELHGDVLTKADEYARALEKAGIPVSAICWGSMKGDMVSEDVSKREPARELLKKVCTIAGQLGVVGGVIYVPAFNGQTELTCQEIRKLLVETLPEIGEHALAAGSRVVMEPLNRKEAYFLRQVADGASIARDCKTDGICVMGDFYHMFYEETSDMGAFISGGDRLHHVHLASRSKSRTLPGVDGTSYVDGFKGLKMIGYQDYCSLECGVKGDAMVEIPKSVKYLKDQWAQA
jgi:sugar phosphate isomerase/epimerase